MERRFDAPLLSMRPTVRTESGGALLWGFTRISPYCLGHLYANESSRAQCRAPLSLLPFPVAAHASAFVPEGGRTARPSPPGAPRRGLDSPASSPRVLARRHEQLNRNDKGAKHVHHHHGNCFRNS